MNMKKIIRKVLKEALGVPEGIVESSKILYSNILSEMEKIPSDSTENEYDFKFNVSLLIGDYTINNVDFNLEIRENDRATEPIITSFAFGAGYDVEVRKKMKIKHMTSDKITLASLVVVPMNWSFEDILELFKTEKVDIIRSLTHELKHSFDYFKNPKRNPYDTSMYQTYATTRLGMKPLDMFIFDLYFTHSVENLVRSSEVGAEIETKGVSQKEFLDFLTNDKVFKELKRISTFSLDQLRSELKNYIPQIDEVLIHLDEPTNISDDEKVERMLDIFYSTLTNVKGEKIKDVISTEMPEKLFGVLNPTKIKHFNKMISKSQRFSSYLDFFEYEEKLFNYVGRKMIKKLGKLYAMSRMDENKQSILDWELYHEAKKTKKTEFTNKIKNFKIKGK